MRSIGLCGQRQAGTDKQSVDTAAIDRPIIMSHFSSLIMS
jgi:hypothetical protein